MCTCIVQLFCFDKTGTLTKEGLEFYGVQPVADMESTDEQEKGKQTTPRFDQQQDSTSAVPRLMQIGLATCHAVTTLNGQFIGNVKGWLFSYTLGSTNLWAGIYHR